MIEILKFDPMTDKGALKGKISIRIEKWGGFIMHDLCLFQKDDKEWLCFPTRKIEDKYLPYMLFDNPGLQKKFFEEILKALKEQCKGVFEK